jgi:hypothetical protein
MRTGCVLFLLRRPAISSGAISPERRKSARKPFGASQSLSPKAATKLQAISASPCINKGQAISSNASPVMDSGCIAKPNANPCCHRKPAQRAVSVQTNNLQTKRNSSIKATKGTSMPKASSTCENALLLCKASAIKIAAESANSSNCANEVSDCCKPKPARQAAPLGLRSDKPSAKQAAHAGAPHHCASPAHTHAAATHAMLPSAASQRHAL